MKMVSPFSSRKGSKEKESKNPYSNRGLDKFSALLSELDEKRQNIYAKRVESDGPPLVRFVFKSSGECVPVMIKTEKDDQDDLKVKTESKTEEEKEIKLEKREQKQQRCVLNENLNKFSRPYHFLPVAAILILTFLLFFGRSVSIMCTCIVWYLVPMIKEQSRKKGSTYKTKKKKRKKVNIENQTVLEEKYPRVAVPGKTTR